MTLIFDYLDRLGRLSGYLAAALIAGIAVLILAEIFCRSLFNLSLSFAWEYSAYFMGAAIFLSAAFTMRTGGHVRVSLLSANLPPRIAKAIEWVATFYGTAIAVYIAYALCDFAWQALLSGSTSPTIDEIPLVYPRGAIAAGAVLLALQMLARSIQVVIGADVEDQTARKTFSIE